MTIDWHKRWRDDRGDETLRLTYDLNEDSIVFDLGGHHGDFAYRINQKYGCRVHVFEPVLSFVTMMEARFANNDQIFVHPYGLSSENKSVIMSVHGDGSNLIDTGRGEQQQADVKDIVETAAKFDKIDLIKINIEGEEYPLLEHCLANDIIKKMVDIQIQFHLFDWIDNPSERKQTICTALAYTHHLTYDYVVWANWRKS